jgi:hypothetical protein
MAEPRDLISSTPDHLINPNNPYYLHPSENPGAVLVTPVLNERNYHSWAHFMHVAMFSKNKHRFLDGSLPQPPATDPLSEVWLRCNNIVVSWLTRCMIPSIASSVMYKRNASDIWRIVKERFSRGDKFRIADLQEEISQCKQGDLIVTEYLTKLTSLWEQLENFYPAPVCICPTPCNCGVLSTIHKRYDESGVIKFLRGLNEEFSYVRSQIMMFDPIPSIKVFSMVIQQENEFGGFPSTVVVDESVAVAQTNEKDYSRPSSKFSDKGGKGGFSKYNKTKPTRFCTHCKRNNHTEETCFLKYGFPVGYQGKQKQQLTMLTPILMMMLFLL